MPPTNGIETVPAVQLPSTLRKEIIPTDTGAEVTFSRHKVYFPADIASQITVLTPDALKLSFRASFLVLANRTTGQSLLLGAVTNRLGLILPPDRVIWTNALDSGPKADIEYRYLSSPDSGLSGLEQNVTLHQSPTVPKDWLPEDVTIEFWTEFFGSVPIAIESQPLELRQEMADAAAIQTEDQTISFGAAKIIAGGRAFTIGAESNSIPVSKAWTLVEPDDPKAAPRTFLVEKFDWLAAKTQLDKLEKAPRTASIHSPKNDRQSLLASLGQSRAAPLSHPLRRRGSAASRMGEGRGEGNQSDGARGRAMLLAKSSALPADGLVLDFTILNAVPLPSGAISWWPAGGNALDAITNHNNGYLSNGVAYVGGKVGQTFFFNGTNSYAKVTDAPSLNQTNGLTVEAWVYLNRRKANNNDMILRKDGECGDREYMLTATLSGKFRAHLGTTNGVYNYIDGVTAVTSNTWYQVAMTYSVANSNLSLYVNGLLEAAGSVRGAIITTTQAVYIGGFPGPCSSYYFPGLIDEPSISNRALSGAEILGIYNAGAAGKVNPNCVSPSTNAVGWWAGDGNVYDSARTNFASLNNGATYAAGVVGQAFSFDGVDDYVKVIGPGWRWGDFVRPNCLTQLAAWQIGIALSLIRKSPMVCWAFEGI